MLQDILFATWFLIPAAWANVAPVLAAHLPSIKRWDTPMDFGRTYRGVPIFGPHKTWRGIVSGIIIGTLFLWLEQLVLSHVSGLQFINTYLDYTTLPLLIVGPLFGIGALGGDAIKSFFKRQRGIPSGKTWMPFDQLDYLLGAIILTLPVVVLPLAIYAWILVIGFVAHIGATYIGWRLRLKEAPL